MNDIGKCMGIYFYLIGLIQIISIVIIQQTIGDVYLDLQFVGFLIAGYYLTKHHNKARKIIIIICGFIVIIQLMLFFYATFAIFPEHATMKLVGIPIKGENAEKYLQYGSLIVALVFSLPIYILRSEKAIKEFNN